MTTVNRLEKVAVNNQIVRMRKDVKRARLWLINSLTHRLKKLKGIKTNELEKNQHKAEKLRNEIYLLKQICIDEVSKFAICNKQELPNLSFNDSELDLSQKLMLQLANHKLVQQQVQVFRQTYTGPMDRLILLVRSLGLQYQKKNKKKQVAGVGSEIGIKMTSDTPKPSSGRKKNDSVPELKENLASENKQNFLSIMDATLSSNLGMQDEIKSNNSDLSSLMEVNYNLVSKMKPPLNGPHPEGNCITEFNRAANLGEQSETVSTASSVEKQLVSQVNFVQKIPWPKLSVPPVNKKFGTMIIKQLHLDSEAEAISLDEASTCLDTWQKINQHPRDSFFLGGVDLSSDDESIKKDSIPLSAKRANKRTPLETKTYREKTYPARSRYQLSNEQALTELKITPSVATLEILHPSWQAKRKEKEQQINIGVCQGKRIRFDD